VARREESEVDLGYLTGNSDRATPSQQKYSSIIGRVGETGNVKPQENQHGLKIKGHGRRGSTPRVKPKLSDRFSLSSFYPGIKEKRGSRRHWEINRLAETDGGGRGTGGDHSESPASELTFSPSYFSVGLEKGGHKARPTERKRNGRSEGGLQRPDLLKSSAGVTRRNAKRGRNWQQKTFGTEPKPGAARHAFKRRLLRVADRSQRSCQGAEARRESE